MLHRTSTVCLNQGASVRDPSSGGHCRSDADSHTLGRKSLEAKEHEEQQWLALADPNLIRLPTKSQCTRPLIPSSRLAKRPCDTCVEIALPVEQRQDETNKLPSTIKDSEEVQWIALVVDRRACVVICEGWPGWAWSLEGLPFQVVQVCWAQHG